MCFMCMVFQIGISPLRKESEFACKGTSFLRDMQTLLVLFLRKSWLHAATNIALISISHHIALLYHYLATYNSCMGFVVFLALSSYDHPVLFQRLSYAFLFADRAWLFFCSVLYF